MAEGKDNDDPDIDIVKKAVANLREFFDGVQIFANRFEMDGNSETTSVQYGDGNFFSRYGQVKEWVIKTEQGIKLSVRTPDDTDE